MLVMFCRDHHALLFPSIFSTLFRTPPPVSEGGSLVAGVADDEAPVSPDDALRGLPFGLGVVFGVVLVMLLVMLLVLRFVMRLLMKVNDHLFGVASAVVRLLG